MYREFLNPVYMEDAEYINQLVEDIYRCERSKEKINILCKNDRNMEEVAEALHFYHLDLQMTLNDYMDAHFVDRETYCCKKRK